MRLLLVALAALIPAVAGAAAVQTTPSAKDAAPAALAKCKQVSAHYYAYRNGKALQPHKLTELPPANAYIAIVRNDGRCEMPVIVRYNMGGR
jgi:hypothetical protein